LRVSISSIHDYGFSELQLEQMHFILCKHLEISQILPEILAEISQTMQVTLEYFPRISNILHNDSKDQSPKKIV